MKHIITLITTCAAMLASWSLHAASPAATQEWVRNYVSTNSSPGGGVTEEWVKQYVAQHGGGTQNYATNSVSGIINTIRLSAVMAVSAATNEAYRVTTAPTTNEINRVMARVSATEWENAPIGIFFETNATKAIYGSYDGNTYETTNFTASVIEFFANAETNRPSVVVLSYMATEDEIKEAKGE